VAFVSSASSCPRRLLLRLGIGKTKCFVGPLESFSSTERFAQVVLADVLEHMVDPWQALRRVVDDLMERDGRVIVSLPNVRNWRVLADLVVLGRWRYVDEGILDRTHL
jgi:2-polyprenyl-3-methyl-5-hydroxy-6-metoxy-1,4-benzoquinol methylase